MRLSWLPTIPLILLALFLSGSVGSLAIISRATFDAAHAELDAEFVGFEQGRVEITYANVTLALGSVVGVRDVEPLLHVVPTVVWSWNASRGFQSPLVAVRDTFYPKLRDLRLEGRIPGPDERAVAIHRAVAQTLKLTVGSTVYYLNWFFNESKGQADIAFLNLTVVGLYGSPIPPRDIRVSGTGPWFETFEKVPTYISVSTVDEVQDALKLDPTATNSGYYWIWAAPGLLDPSDLEGTARNLARLEAALKEAARPYAIQISNEVKPLLASVRAALSEQQQIFIATGSPLIAFSLVLAFLATELGMRPRLYEFAVMKARGADERFLTKRLAFGSVGLGFVGGGLGLLSGSLAGSLAAGTAVRLVVPPLHISAFLIALAVAIALLASVGPVGALRKIPLARALVDPRAASEWNPVAPKKILWGSTLASGALAIGFVQFGAGTDVAGAGLSTLFVFFGPVLIMILFLQAALDRVSVWQDAASRLLAPLAGPMSLPFSGGARIRRKRTTTLTVAMTLGLAFALLVGIGQSSQLDYDRRFVRAEVGADIVLETGPYDANLTANLTREPGVVAVSSATALLGDHGIYAVDLRNYTAATYFTSDYLLAGSWDDLLDTTGMPRMALTKAFAEFAGLGVGDVFRISLSYTLPGLETRQVLYDFSIAAVVLFLPGVGSNPGLVGTPNYTAIDFGALPADLLPYHLRNSHNSRYFLRVAPGVDPLALADRLAAGGASWTIEVTQAKFREVATDPIRTGVSTVLYAESLYASLLLGAGVAMVVVFAHWDRRLELGTLIARGCSGTEIFRLTLADVLVSLIQSVPVAFVIGISGAAILEFVALPSHPLVPRTLVMDFVSVGGFVVLAVLVVLLSTLASGLVTKRTVRESIRVRVIG